MLECVVNISEGRRGDVLRALAESVEGGDLLDVHVDSGHHRSVWTLLGTTAPRRLTRSAVELLNLAAHQGGAHPRLGVVDVVPFVPLGSSTMAEAVAARNDFAQWLATELSVPSFLYGLDVDANTPERTLPDIRRHAWHELRPDVGPLDPHPTAGAVCVGARGPLVAYNIWLAPGGDASRAREVTGRLRSAGVRALTLALDDRLQISTNLVDPMTVGPLEVYKSTATLCAERDLVIERSELVGLIPQEVLDKIPEAQWPNLDLSAERTIEYRRTHGYRFTI